MIALDDYWMGRGRDVSDALTINARATVLRASTLLTHYLLAYPDASHPVVASGYRPPEINAGIAGAAPNSLHMTCEAVDLVDMPCLIDGRMKARPFARWCLSRLDVLADLNLWMEDPRATRGARPWVHVQTRPPRSGRRVFIPDANWSLRLAGKPLTDASIT